MPDEDIMNRLKEIDEDEILGEEVSFDADLDFEGLDDLDSPSAAAVAPAAAAPPVPTGTVSDDMEQKKPAAKKSSTKARPSKPKAAAEPVRPPAHAETSATEVEEVVVRAKVLRIVADRVIIEPGDSISFSP